MAAQEVLVTSFLYLYNRGSVAPTSGALLINCITHSVVAALADLCKVASSLWRRGDTDPATGARALGPLVRNGYLTSFTGPPTHEPHTCTTCWVLRGPPFCVRINLAA